MNLTARLLIVCLVPLAASACASRNSYCLKPQKYDDAASLPPFQPVEGLTVPSSQTALRVPPLPANPVPFGQADAEGTIMCLDQPPPLERKKPTTVVSG